MGVLKRLTRARPVQAGVGLALARYLGLVRRTTRFELEPADAYDRLTTLKPFIIAMWHGQHFMVPFVRRPQDAAASLVSRSGDGELNAIALRHLGIRAIRGSGARGRSVREKGGIAALRGMLAALEAGETVALTADVPKIARRCGEGIIALARLSGRPILPMAVVTGRRIQFDSWDKASVGLPFGRGAMIVGNPIEVARGADDAEVEAARRAVEDELNRIHARAFGLVGARDPAAAPEPNGRTLPVREAETPGTGT